MTDGEFILWRRLDVPGHDIATITRQPRGWLVTGVAAFAQGATPCRVDYDIRCDAAWITRVCRLRTSIGAKRTRLDIARRMTGEWTVDGEIVADLRGCDDIDLGCSPVTNVLPIGGSHWRSARARPSPRRGFAFQN